MNAHPIKPSDSSRRNFMKAASTTAAGLTAVTAVSARSAENTAGSNERLRIGVIGAGQRGFGSHIKAIVNLRKIGSPTINLTRNHSLFSQRPVSRRHAPADIATPFSGKLSIYSRANATTFQAAPWCLAEAVTLETQCMAATQRTG